MHVRAVVFDFDGLVLDTETVILRSWQDEFAFHGVEFPTERWIASNVGTTGHENPHYVDEVVELERLLGAPVDRGAVQERKHRRRVELMEDLGPNPGVVAWLDAARAAGLSLAVASSSARWWIDEHLGRLGLADRFHHLSCADEVGAAKPDPAVYVDAIEALGVDPAEAVALEDSPHGVRAAKAAGLFCVAVPSEVTKRLDFPPADLVVPSLAEFGFDDLLAYCHAHRHP